MLNKTCLTCGNKITQKRFRRFCSHKCRNKYNNKKQHQYRAEWQRNYWGRYEKGRIQCLICGKWYFQLGSHVAQTHKMPAREYRKQFGYDVKSGKSILAKHLHELYGKQAIENKTYKNLKAGKKYWFKKGDKKAGRYERSEQTMARLKKKPFIIK